MRAIIVQALWFRRDRESNETRMSYEALGEMVGCSADTAKRQVKWLVENGYMTKTRASSHDATSVFAISEEALTSDDAPAPRANSSAGPGGSASSTRRIRTVEQGNVPSSTVPPVEVVRERQVDQGKLPSSDQGNLPSSTTSKNEKNSSTPSDGFNEFWGQYPATRWKGKKDECRRLWLSLPHEDRQDAYRALMHYKESVIWQDDEGVSAPMRFLQNEPWLEVRAGTLPRKVKKIKMLTAEDIRLPD